MRYGLRSDKRDNMRAISCFRCGVVEAQALGVIIHYKFQTKYTYCLRTQSCLFAGSRKTEIKEHGNISGKLFIFFV